MNASLEHQHCTPGCRSSCPFSPHSRRKSALCAIEYAMMATRAAYTHGRHASSASNTMAYPPLPGSPTLTNPDMILPDYDRADSPDDLNPSQLTAWRTAHASPLDFHLPHSNYSSTPVQPSTPIIYGNGTMLSDIGEVTEVESTVGRRTSSRYSIRSDDTHGPQPALSAMKPMLQGRSQVAVRERRASVDSTSTITTQGHAAPFADFDDSASVDDFSCQGDDEESIASSWVDNPGAFNAQPVVKPQDQEQAHNPDRYSTTSISKRAEKILANAKRRLTVSFFSF